MKIGKDRFFFINENKGSHCDQKGFKLYFQLLSNITTVYVNTMDTHLSESVTAEGSDASIDASSEPALMDRFDASSDALSDLSGTIRCA